MKSRRRLFFTILVTLASGASTCCERDTRVSITQSKNPPTFQLAGNGKLLAFVIAGPFSSSAEMESAPKSGANVLWTLLARDFPPVPDLSPVTYGVAPAWGGQAVPERGAPRPLEEGKFYAVSPYTSGASFRLFCFTISGGEAIKVSCGEK
jgi:hypothetical protein